MTKLCPRGKAAAKRKFKVYPSAYANAYASKICAGKMAFPVDVNANPREIRDRIENMYGFNTMKKNFGMPIPEFNPAMAGSSGLAEGDFAAKDGGRARKTKFSKKKRKQANKMRKK